MRWLAALRPPDPEFPGFAPEAPVPPVDHWDDGTAGATPDQRAAIVAAFVEAGEGLEAAGYCSTEGRHSRPRVDHRAASRKPGHDGSTGRHPPPRDRPRRRRHRRRLRPGDVRAARRPGRGRLRNARRSQGVVRPEPDGAAAGQLRGRARAPGGGVGARVPAYMGFNGKAHADGTSFVHLGEQQWDAIIEIWDDATDRRALGVGFDAEGTPSGGLDLVHEGVSAGLTHDRRSRSLAGVEPTGHSVGSEAFGGYASNLFLGGGDQAPDRLLGQMERGLLVTGPLVQPDPRPQDPGGDGPQRNGLFLVEEGRIAGPVQNLRYTQSIVGGFGPGKVLALGNDAQLVGSEGGTMHVPSARLAAWAFTGNARGSTPLPL